MRQLQQGNSNIVEDTHDLHNLSINVRSMPDPEDVYSCTLGASDTSQSTVHIPNIRDGDGNIILPQDYESKLQDQSIVIVNVYLKLWVHYKNFITITIITFSQQMDLET